MKISTLSFLFFSVLSANMFAATGIQEALLNITEISGGSGDITEIYFASGTSQAYKALEDSKKIFDTLGPQIYSLTSDMVPCYSNGFGTLAKSVVITLGFKVKEEGTYVFSASKLSNFDEGSIILLEDRVLGTFTDLRQQTDTLTISGAGQNQSRFYLHVSSPPVLSVIAAGCTNEKGIVTVTEDSATLWTSILLFDSSSRLVSSLNDTTNNLGFGNLSSGTYIMAFTSGNYTFVKTFLMTTNQILINISSPVIGAEVGQTIQFYSDANDATEYTWNFGDSSIITGIANPGYEYYQPGTYTVSLHASNAYNCSANASITLDVAAQSTTSIATILKDSVNVYADHKNVVIASAIVSESSSVCSIYNLAGQLLVSSPITSSYFSLNLDNQAAGLYLVQVKTQTGSFSKKIFLGYN